MTTAGSLDKLLDKVQIDFPTTIHNDEAEKLLDYLSLNAKSSIRFELTTENKIYYVEPTKKTKKDDHQPSKITGTMRPLKGRSIDFEFLTPYKNSPLHDGIRFHTPPGYMLPDIPKDQIMFMESIGKYVKQYFSERK